MILTRQHMNMLSRLTEDHILKMQKKTLGKQSIYVA